MIVARHYSGRYITNSDYLVIGEKMVNKKLLIEKVAEMMGISRSEASRMLRNGEIHLLKIDGKSGRVSHEDLNEYISIHKTNKGDQNG